MRRVLAPILGCLVVLLLPAAAGAYSWPLRPFYKPHALRGNFNDPRINGPTIRSFHHGVDIIGDDLERVYAIEGGRARVHGQTVAIPRRGRTLSYWHVIPAVRSGQRVRQHQVIGYIAPGFGHVHLSEFTAGTYINPLRLGGLAPYVDDTVPRIPSLQFYFEGQLVPPEVVTGTVDIAVDAYDTNALPVPPPDWMQARLAPATIRWRIVQGQNTVRQWERPVDFRMFLVPPELFSFIYTPGTWQNRPARPGRYEYYLSHQFDSRTLPNGSYVLQVEAWDAQGNVGTAHFAFTVTNR